MDVAPTRFIAGQGEASGVAKNQREVIDFLSRPESYGVERVHRFETHGNLVFLAGADAYKIKRAVQFAYMDFSTLAKRRAACHREVEANRRWAPDLYLNCVAITRLLRRDACLRWRWRDRRMGRAHAAIRTERPSQ